MSRDPVRGHCLAGSLTGAVSCQRVTQEPKGSLSTDGNGAVSVKVYGSLTARHTSRAVAILQHYAILYCMEIRK